MENKFIRSYICKNQESLFVYAHEHGINIFEFILAFMKSDVRRRMDQDYSYLHHQCKELIYDLVIEEYPMLLSSKQIDNTNITAIGWLGYFYAKWHFITNESSKEILKFLKPKDGIKKWYVLHTIDEREAINRIKEDYNNSRNAHRKYDFYKSKDYENLMQIIDKANTNNEYSILKRKFLAKRFLHKLKGNNYLNTLKFINPQNIDSVYDFVDETHSTGLINIDFCNLSIKSEEEILKIIKKRISKINQSIVNETLLFCNLASREQTIDVNKFKVILRKNKINSAVYLLSNNQLIEINSVNEINAFYIPVTRRDIKGVDYEIVSLVVSKNIIS